MVFYGLADWQVNDVVEWFPTRKAAEATLAQVLRDEPDFEAILGVVRVDFASVPVQVDVLAGAPRR